MRWLTDCSRGAVAEALGVVAPWLAGETIVISDRWVQSDPVWASASAVVGDRYVVKYAWAEPAARRLWHEIAVLRALATGPPVPRVPRVVAVAANPLLLVLERVHGSSLFEVYHSLPSEGIGAQLASFLAALHQQTVRAHLTGTLELLPTPLPPADTGELRRRLPRWLRTDQHRLLAGWCDWADAVLTPPRAPVIVHGDFHGDNQLWDQGRLRLVVDFETVGLGEAEYDFRGIAPLGWSVGPLVEAMQHYGQITGTALSIDRVMAWHLRTTLGYTL